MSFEVRYTSHFSKAIKRLAKKYPSVRTDFSALFTDIQTDPMIGSPIGRSCYKIRMPIRSKGKGKSGGARVITYVHIVNNLVVLLTVYDKSEKATLTDAERDHLIDLVERL